jgi:hypothetical protein
MKQKQVRLDEIVADTSLQVRKEINGWYVSKYVQVLKSGKNFKDSIVVLPDMRIVSGFTRYEAYKRVLDPSDKIPVRIYEAESEEDAFQFAVRENITHGQPLEEFEKKSIRRRLQHQGWTDEQISQFIGVSLERLYKWDAERVVVNSGGKQQQEDTKPGTRLPQQVSQKQYEQHVNHHAVSTVFHARKVLQRIKDGTIERDEKTVNVLEELRQALEDELAAV